MKRIIKYFYGMAAAAGICLAAGCDKTYVNETVSAAPVIASFTPASAPVGAEIVVTGEHLSGVYKAFIGDKEMTIVEKVSDSRLTIRAGAGGRDGKIVLQNSVGRGESEAAFTYTYAVPELTEALLPESVAMSDDVLLAGSNLSAVEAVIFTASGHEGHEGEIVEQRASELVVRVPYVESDAVEITLRYFDGTASVVSEKASPIKVVRIVPEFDPVTVSGRVNVGQSVTLTGRNLDKVGRILVGGYEATCTKQAESLTFVVPAGEFADGQTQTTLAAEYFDGNETQTLSEAFVVYVPLVLYWQDITVEGHGRKTENHTSFFSPATGRAYANAQWGTALDPVAFEYRDKTCSASQTPAVSEELYNSVPPYFFFYGNNSGDIAITSPANSSSILKNFWAADASDGRLFGTTTPASYGTPVMAFLPLTEATAGTEVAELIAAVKAGTLENIDEAAFPVVGTTIRGIDMTAASPSLKDSEWAPGMVTDRKSSKPGIAPNSVVLVVYLTHEGPDTAGDAKNYASHVKRIGLLHMTGFDYLVEAEGASKATLGRYTFNCYWQKYDYDYTKLK